MAEKRVIPVSEMEQMTPDQRAQVVNDHLVDSLDGLDAEFRARVEAKGRRLLEELGLFDSEPS